MFEKAILRNGSTRTPLGMALGISGEAAALAVAIVIPLIYTEHLPAFSAMLPLVVPSRPPGPPPDNAVNAAKAQGARVVKTAVSPVFQAPVRVPKGAPIIIEQPETAAVGPYVVGSAESGPSRGVLPAGINTNFAPPPPPPPEKPKIAAVEKKPDRLKIGGVVLEAKILMRVIPVYPPLARQTRVQGTVLLVGVIARDGTVQELSVVSGHPLLVKAAVDAVRQWVYRPTLLNGDPVEVVAPIEVRFTLGR